MKLNHSISRKSHSAGFTLLEMVIVMVIMGILAGGVIALIGNVQDTAREARAEQDMRTFGSYFEAYRSKTKFYPSTEQGLKALTEKPSTSPVPRKWSKQLNEVPTDPWNQPYSYTNNGGKSFTLICNGVDQELGTDDDLVYDSKQGN